MINNPVAIENIGPKESRKRLVFGVFMLFFSAFMMVILIIAEMSRFWRIILFIPILMGTIGFFQSREKT
jgi:hypothetical protein